MPNEVIPWLVRLELLFVAAVAISTSVAGANVSTAHPRIVVRIARSIQCCVHFLLRLPDPQRPTQRVVHEVPILTALLNRNNRPDVLFAPMTRFIVDCKANRLVLWKKIHFLQFMFSSTECDLRNNPLQERRQFVLYVPRILILLH